MTQKQIQFSLAEASFNDRKMRLGMALINASACIRMVKLSEWVFVITQGGTEGQLKKSFQELAARPWGLCCNERSARRTAKKCQAAGLVAIEWRRSPGGNLANGYSIDWGGVAKLIPNPPIGPGQNVRTPQDKMSVPPGQNVLAINNPLFINHKNNPLKVGNLGKEDLAPEIFESDASNLARELSKLIGGGIVGGDWLTFRAVCRQFLNGEYSESDFRGAIEAVKRNQPEKPIAYLKTCLARRTAEVSK